MSAYLIVRMQVTDPAKFEAYKALSTTAVQTYGGRFLARGGRTEVLEGEPEDRRIVVVEFPSFEQAKACYDSPEYRKARDARAGAAEGQLLVVEGL